jgi:hypothetical protein
MASGKAKAVTILDKKTCPAKSAKVPRSAVNSLDGDHRIYIVNHPITLLINVLHDAPLESRLLPGITQSMRHILPGIGCYSPFLGTSGVPSAFRSWASVTD